MPHHLVDLVDPAEDFSLARFQKAGRDAIADIEARGKTPLLVGGTGLYVRALVDDLDLPSRYPKVRAELESEPDTTALHRRLVEDDPVAAARMEPTNRRRVIRALEVGLGSGRPFSSFGPGLGTYPETGYDLVGVWLPRKAVARRIERRYEQQLDDGFLAEVAALADRPGGLSSTARQALGYKELLDHLDAQNDLAAALATAISRTRRFSRRQRVWFRRDPRIRWYAHASNPAALTEPLLEDWSRCA